MAASILPGPGSNDSCPFTDLNSLLGYVTSNQVDMNVSLLIQACPETCLMIYGSGNPDISGIGTLEAMISYTIQGVTSVLFGPLLGLISLYIGSSSNSDSFLGLPPNLWVTEYFGPVARNLHQANILTAFSVLVASRIRLQQVCPVAEVEFIQTLAIYEFCTAIICTVSYFPIHESSRVRSITIGLYAFGAFVMLILVSMMPDYYNSSNAAALEAITTYCVTQADWPVDFTTVKLETILVVIGFFPLPLMTLVVLPLHCRYSWLAEALELHIGPRRLGTILAAVALTELGCLYLWKWLNLLLTIRQRLQLASGQAYQDNEWGFGQISAVMTWIPVVQEVIFSTSGALLHFRRNRQRARDGASPEQHELLPRAPDTHHPYQPYDVSSITPRVSSAAQREEGSPSLESSSQGEPTIDGIARSTSMTLSSPGLQPRVSWPRNRNGTYPKSYISANHVLDNRQPLSSQTPSTLAAITSARTTASRPCPPQLKRHTPLQFNRQTRRRQLAPALSVLLDYPGIFQLGFTMCLASLMMMNHATQTHRRVPITPPTTAPASCGVEKPPDDAGVSGDGITFWVGVVTLVEAKLVDVSNVEGFLDGLVDESEELVATEVWSGPSGKALKVCVVAESVTIVVVVIGVSLVTAGTVGPGSVVRSAGRQLSWSGRAKKYAGEFIGNAFFWSDVHTEDTCYVIAGLWLTCEKARITGFAAFAREVVSIILRLGLVHASY
ncbi:hypothetical protein CONLIGDRAFT_671902 [Coniochaeta ligniaria NRRL 30616]|uniref:Uncharacterized protein n=1 Tax=Coniochaeta ligniaria NRRL 30616 TaxID=1408157 RepID=A0A1J7JAQ3_9PEZI|nr:hypothetical protein CONLIGDRAFT_671902 [Coniochaeta ligniaria NRRL 30616]